MRDPVARALARESRRLMLGLAALAGRASERRRAGVSARAA